MKEVINLFTGEDMENMALETGMLFCSNFTSGIFSSKTLVKPYTHPLIVPVTSFSAILPLNYMKSHQCVPLQQVFPPQKLMEKMPSFLT